jgi:hypothetical protein
MFSCEEDKPCDILVDGVYQFPELPENHDMTSKEVAEYWNLPKDICECISTEGLIETCLNYPDIDLILAGANPQSGYNMVAERFRGLEELSSRSDRATYLLKKFKEIDPLGYNTDWNDIDISGYIINNIWYYQIILSQYINLETFTNKQKKIELIEEAIETYDKCKEDTENNNDIFSLGSTAVVMGRLMKVNEYKPFMKLWEENDVVGETIEFYWPTTYEAVDLIYTLSKDYLQTLKSEK